MTINADDFGTWLKRTLIQLGMKQGEFAHKAGFDDAVISNIINKGRKPKIETLDRMAVALGVDPLDLYVTAGAVKPEVVGRKPLPMPAPTARRDEYEEYIRKHIPGITKESVSRMIEAYDDMIRRESSR